MCSANPRAVIDQALEHWRSVGEIDRHDKVFIVPSGLPLIALSYSNQVIRRSNLVKTEARCRSLKVETMGGSE